MVKCQFCKDEPLPPDYGIPACPACSPGNQPPKPGECERCRRKLPAPKPGLRPFTYCYPCNFEIFKIDWDMPCQPLENGRKGWKGVTKEGIGYSCEIFQPDHNFGAAICIDGRVSYRTKEEMEYIRRFAERVNWYEETPETIRERIKQQERDNVKPHQ